MSRLIRLACAALAVLIVAMPAAPAVAAPSAVEDCLTVIGDENLVDVAVCAVWLTLPPDIAGAVGPYVLPLLRDPLVRCATAHLGACDGVVCAASLQAPDVAGVLDVRPDGDVYVAGELMWDCPPYEVTRQPCPAADPGASSARRSSPT